eukprot:TRINITY_DN26188_c0_g8_i1.p1 TRINITY_DN26188_c0_g8~~TRINITY_DN26188_c0_g8_i1.p1  ORF type:complete len:543 (+),score=80.12 TRINITY_DN26188_c0_g8_i1:138-1766(+)
MLDLCVCAPLDGEVPQEMRGATKEMCVAGVESMEPTSEQLIKQPFMEADAPRTAREAEGPPLETTSPEHSLRQATVIAIDAGIHKGIGQNAQAQGDDKEEDRSTVRSPTKETVMRIAQTDSGRSESIAGVDDSTKLLQLQLFCASAEGQVDAVLRALESRASVNLHDYGGQSALHVAAGHGHDQVVELLLEQRSAVTAADHAGLTPLVLAQQGGHTRTEELLTRGKFLAQRDPLQRQATLNSWAIKSTEIEKGDKLSETIKSDVFKATWRGLTVVAKYAKVYDAGGDIDSEALRFELLHEIRVLSSLRHPDLVMFLGAIFEDDNITFLTEFMAGGDLERYYRRKKQENYGHCYKPDLRELLPWASSISRALCFLHNCLRPILHRDLKPLNLLFTKDFTRLKVSDFGISKELTVNPSSQRKSEYKMSGGVGSWRYMAPEVVRCEEYTEKIDIYAFGLILYFMSTGRDPFYEWGRDCEVILKEYLKGNEPRPKMTECHPELREVMASMWHVNSTSRPCARQLVDTFEELQNVPQSKKCTTCKTM